MYTYNPKLNHYNIQIRNELVTLTVIWLQCYLAENRTLVTKRGKHHFYEMQYVLEGGLLFQVADETFHLHKGEFIIVTPEVEHEITEFLPHTKKIVFAFDAVFRDHVLSEKLSQTCCTVYKETSCLRTMAELLLSLPDKIIGVSGMQIRCIMEAFFLTLLQIEVPEIDEMDPSDVKLKKYYKDSLVDQIITYIRSHDTEKFPTLEELTQIFYISKRHLSRIFLQTTGKTARALLDEERLRYIRELLSTTTYSLAEIAARAGFSNVQSLIRFFKTHEGYTPGTFRRFTLS